MKYFHIPEDYFCMIGLPFLLILFTNEETALQRDYET